LLLTLPLLVPLASGQNSTERGKKEEPDKKKSEPTPAGTQSPVEKANKKPARAKSTARIVEFQFVDSSSLRLAVQTEQIELTTPYGKLLIPVRDIERIEFATRIPEVAAKRIDAAIRDLGHAEFERREAASAELLELRERAYPALLKAEDSSDREVVRRARELLEQIRAALPEEYLEVRAHDVVYTADSKFTGRISSGALKVRTFQFGDQQLQLADVRGLRLPSATDAEAMNALPDPGNLMTLQGQIGTIHAYRVTGAAQAGQPAPGAVAGGLVVGAGITLWGTDLYTLDSNLALAAVHAGVLKPGQAGVVRVKIFGPQATFQGSTRHGVTSAAFGPFNGAFQFVRGRSAERR
jgi:hypothetical protein